MSTNVTAAQIENVLTIMKSEIGKPYSEAIPARFGTSVFDCSGLIWYAFTKAGIPMPGGPSDDAAAIVDPEIQWLSKQPGAKVITDASKVQAGDVIGFVGADPGTTGSTSLVNGKVELGGGASPVASMGHIGMATSNTEYVSAYDTAEGVTTNPISSDQFVVAVRPAPGVYGGSGGSTPTSGSGGITFPSSITDMFGEADKFVTAAMWLFKPGSWVRIGGFLVGIALLLFAIHAFSAVANGTPIIRMPDTVPLPVPV